MTIEKAIQVLKALWCYKDTKYSDTDIRNALDIAINSLEKFKDNIGILANIQEDYMSREKAISILYQYSLQDMTYPKEDIDAFKMAIKALENFK